MDLFEDLRVFFAGTDDRDTFVDVQKVLRTVVHYVTVDIPTEKLVISLNVPYVRAESIRGEGQRDAARWENAPSIAASPETPVVDRPKPNGEGDGTRTRNHQIDSLVL